MAKKPNYDQAYTDKFATMNQEAVQALTRIGGDPVPEEPDQEEPKAAAPKAERKKAKLEDLYSLHTYWIRKDLITKIRDYAYTERRSVRQAINKIIDIAFDQIEKEYQAKGKNLEHYEGDEEL